MNLSRRGFIRSTAGLVAASSFGVPAFAQEKPFVVNMFGGRWENDWRQHVMPKFAEQVGRPFSLDIGMGTSWIANFRAAGPENPPFPAVMLNEKYTAMLRNDGYFATLTPENVPNMANVITPAILKGNTAVTGMLAPLVLVYRTDLVKEPPRGWADLWHPRFRGQLGLYQITNSAATMMALWAGEHFGSGRDDIETAVAKFKELAPFPQLGYSAQLTPLLIQGQITVAPLDVGEVKAMQDQGIPVDYVVPEEGMMVFDHSFSVFEHSEDKQLGFDYVNFVLSPEIQLWMAENWLIAPVNTTVQMPEALNKWPLQPELVSKAIRFDWDDTLAITPRLNDLWERTI
ncbi:putative spermidine/putrescine transport system substrate-binding protein [Paracoccus pantotrophus]|uniref:Extracellular solute-binding protein n=1 Tax=Paracoccus pantotrophus TaxID=82367 RepID=A0AAE6TWM5_PARPN|nr:extracellular solute-binding protein [Paracoccus pantotrophus]QFG37590.1 extracellular solute-binding protein [Paracoccus pantotrophus]RKS51951.1 putative spermidine/putrescine transport system substrate-binding protein [Paracoccus pantotrophus]